MLSVAPSFISPRLGAAHAEVRRGRDQAAGRQQRQGRAAVPGRHRRQGKLLGGGVDLTTRVWQANVCTCTAETAAPHDDAVKLGAGI